MIEYNHEIDYIVGVQGRYFIPFLPAILVGLSGNREINNSYKIRSVLYYSYAFISHIIILYNRYWFS